VARGHVFVTHTGSPRRATLLIDHLAAAHLDVVADADIQESGGWAGASNMAYAASAVVIAFGDEHAIDDRSNGNRMDWLVGSASGALLPVKLHPHAIIAVHLGDLRPFDLAEWNGGEHPELHRLIAALLQLVGRRESRLQPWAPTLAANQGQIDSAEHAVSSLQDLTNQISGIGELLLDDEPAAKDLNAALDEIGRTYRAVNNAVEAFLSASGVAAGAFDAQSYFRLARGNLNDSIHNSRGSCSRIATLYGRTGGIRNALQRRASTELLHAADNAFGLLSTADGDLFQRMEELGGALTNESKLIANLLLAGQPDAARQRITDGWGRLDPIDQQLQGARKTLQGIQVRLGYVEDTQAHGGTVKVSIQRIHIGGDVVNSSIVVAHTIEGSWNAVERSSVSSELKALLADLHKAVSTLAESLDPDDAELAARDLEDLSREAVSPSPRPAWWQRAAQGLLTAAKKTAEVGVPVIDLIARITALMGAA
jgi:hypothetical protein